MTIRDPAASLRTYALTHPTSPCNDSVAGVLRDVDEALFSWQNDKGPVYCSELAQERHSPSRSLQTTEDGFFMTVRTQTPTAATTSTYLYSEKAQTIEVNSHYELTHGVVDCQATLDLEQGIIADLRTQRSSAV